MRRSPKPALVEPLIGFLVSGALCFCFFSIISIASIFLGDWSYWIKFLEPGLDLVGVDANLPQIDSSVNLIPLVTFIFFGGLTFIAGAASCFFAVLLVINMLKQPQAQSALAKSREMTGEGVSKSRELSSKGYAKGKVLSREGYVKGQEKSREYLARRKAKKGDSDNSKSEDISSKE